MFNMLAKLKELNPELEIYSMLFAKNKWLICHDKNDALIKRGVYLGIHGKNYEIKY